MAEQIRLSAEQIRAIEAVLNSGSRAELIPVRGGVRIFRQRRDEVKIPSSENR